MKWHMLQVVLITLALVSVGRGDVLTDDFTGYASQAAFDARYDVASDGNGVSAAILDAAADTLKLRSDNANDGGWIQAIDTANTFAFAAGDSLAVEVDIHADSQIYSYFRFGIANAEGTEGLMVEIMGAKNTNANVDQTNLKVVQGIDGVYSTVASAFISDANNRYGVWRIEVDDTNVTVSHGGQVVAGLSAAHGLDLADFTNGARAAVANAAQHKTLNRTYVLNAITFEGTAIPEPATAGLLGVGSLLVLARRR